MDLVNRPTLKVTSMIRNPFFRRVSVPKTSFSQRKIVMGAWVFAGAWLLTGCFSEKNPAAPESPGTVKGRLLDDNGIPQSGVRVVLNKPVEILDSRLFTSERIPGDTLQSDSEGRFVFPDVAEGQYSLEVLSSDSSLGYFASRLDKGAEAMNLGNLYLTRPGVMRGRLQLTGAPEVRVVVENTPFFTNVSDNGTFDFAGLPPGQFQLHVIQIRDGKEDREAIHSQSVVITSGRTTQLGAINLLLPSGWSHFRELTLNTTASGAELTESLAGFPLPIRFTQENFPFADALEKGADIRVALGSRQLPMEWERYDADAKEAVLWVLMDTLYADSLHDLRIYWGNPEAKPVSSGKAVFLPSQGFDAVWHLDSAIASGSLLPEPAYTSSAENSRPARAYISSTGKDGVIGRGRHFDGLDDYLSLTTTAFNSALTFSAWVKADSLPSGRSALWQVFREADAPFGISVYFRSDTLFFIKGNGEVVNPAYAPGVMEVDKWMHLAVVVNGNGKTAFYKNGNKVEDGDDETLATAVFSGVKASLSAEAAPFPGSLDEVRISLAQRSPAWIRFCFASQKSDSDLIEWK